MQIGIEGGRARVNGRARSDGTSTDSSDDIRVNEERLRLALTIGRLAMWDWDMPSGRVFWSDEHYTLEGYEPGEVMPCYEAWAARVHPDDRVAAAQAVLDARDGDGVYRSSFRSLHPGGRIVWLRARGRFFYDAENRPVRMIGIMQDVTDEMIGQESQAILDGPVKLGAL